MNGEIHYRRSPWRRTADGRKVREYIVFTYQYREDRTVKLNAYPTFDKPWPEVADILPPTVINYDLVWAEGKPAAIASYRGKR